MTVSSFLQYVRTELRQVPHPYLSDADERLEDPSLLVRVVDHVLVSATDQYETLGEDFYSALNSYLTAPRHRKAVLRGAIDRLATFFEGFLRTVVVLWPELDRDLLDENGDVSGRLSTQGYIYHFASLLLGIDRRLSAAESGWRKESAFAAVLRVCHKHQQRAKHEARDFTLAELEELARSILASYLVVAHWLVTNTDVALHLAARLTAASGQAVCYWPSILAAQLDDLRFDAQDKDLAEHRDALQETATELGQRAEEILKMGIAEDSDSIDALRVSCESLAFEYEMLVTESNMRSWGREQQWSEYL